MYPVMIEKILVMWTLDLFTLNPVYVKLSTSLPGLTIGSIFDWNLEEPFKIELLKVNSE